MDRNSNVFLKVFGVIFFTSISLIAQGQDYQEQRKLIRPKPGHSIILGQVVDHNKEAFTSGKISIFDPVSFKISETIPIDKRGEFLFTLALDKKVQFIIELPGYFPYVYEYTALEAEEEQGEDFKLQITIAESVRNYYTLMYDTNSTDLDSDEKKKLENIIQNIKELPGINVYLICNNDDQGSTRSENLSQAFGEYDIPVVNIQPLSLDQVISIKIIEKANPENLTISEDNEEKAETLFTIQIAAAKTLFPADHFKGIKNVKPYRGKDGFYRYTFGEFVTKAEAEIALDHLKPKGYEKAFIKEIAYYKQLQ